MTRRVIASLILLLCIIISIVAARSLTEFRIEASSDSLVLENDPAIGVYDRSRVVFGNDEYVFVTLTTDNLFDEATLCYLDDLSAKLKEINGIASASSLTQLPLFRSQKQRPNAFHLMAGPSKFPTLIIRDEDGKAKINPKVVLEKAKQELTNHELFRGNLIGADGKIAAIIVTFEQDKNWQEAAQKFFALRNEFNVSTEAAKAKLKKKFEQQRAEYRKLETERKDLRVRIVRDIRDLIKNNPPKAGTLHASGLPTIIVDMVNAIKADISNFSWLSLLFIAAFLAIVFQRFRWVLLSLVPCLLTVLWVLASFVWEDKRMTVVTCNIPSLLLVVGIAHAIHFIVRFQEESRSHGTDESRYRTIWRSVNAIIKPCFYTALTTGIGFVSLILANIRPVVDFGVHMSIGVALAFILTFLILPATLLLWPAQARGQDSMAKSSKLLKWLASTSLSMRWPIVVLAVVIVVFSVTGYQRISAEASFVGYFREGSAVRESLEHIDRKLGGTTQFEILLSSKKPGFFKTPQGLREINKVEAILNQHPKVIGNVVGLGAVVKEVKKVTTAAGLAFPEAMLLQNFVPKMGEDQLRSYVNNDWTQTRIVARIHDTAENLNRVQFLEAIDQELKQQVKIEAKRTGVFVLYTNMLNSLTKSQTTTAAYVLLFIFLAVAILLRSLKFALISMIPNVLPILLVLGMLGWLGIPLDMATVMIASIALGIAIDGTIHYTVRFRTELASDKSVTDAIIATHESIGVAIFYTTLTCIAGFWVLMFSHFNPNFYFGLFTGLAMLTSLFATLTLLPVCLFLITSSKPSTQPNSKDTPKSTTTDKSDNPT